MKLKENKDPGRNVFDYMGDEHEFSLDVSNVAFLINLLTKNLYKDKESSVLREIVSNAIDANKDAGSNKKIQIRLWTDGEKNNKQLHLSVKDTGPGMSPETIKKVYTVIGKSNRRHSNDFIGGWGLGSKSPFALSSTFTCITRHKGREYTYSIARNEKDIPYIQLITDFSSDEPSGTEIKIPVGDYLGANTAALWVSSAEKTLAYVASKIDLKYTWKVHTIYHKHKTIHDLANQKVWHFPFFSVAKYPPISGIHIMLGNIPYELSLEKILPAGRLTDKSHQPDIALRFEVGELEPTPDREGIQYDEHNITRIATRLNNAAQYIASIYNETYKNTNDFQTWAKHQMEELVIPLGNHSVGIYWIKRMYPDIELNVHWSAHDKVTTTAAKLGVKFFSKFIRVRHVLGETKMISPEANLRRDLFKYILYRHDASHYSGLTTRYLASLHATTNRWIDRKVLIVRMKDLNDKDIVSEIKQEMNMAFFDTVNTNTLSDAEDLLIQAYNSIARYEDNYPPESWIIANKRTLPERELKKHRVKCIAMYPLRTAESGVGWVKGGSLNYTPGDDMDGIEWVYGDTDSYDLMKKLAVMTTKKLQFCMFTKTNVMKVNGHRDMTPVTEFLSKPHKRIIQAAGILAISEHCRSSSKYRYLYKSERWLKDVAPHVALAFKHCEWYADHHDISMHKDNDQWHSYPSYSKVMKEIFAQVKASVGFDPLISRSIALLDSELPRLHAVTHHLKRNSNSSVSPDTAKFGAQILKLTGSHPPASYILAGATPVEWKPNYGKINFDPSREEEE